MWQVGVGHTLRVVSAVRAQAVVEALEASPEEGRALRAEAMRMLSELPGYSWCGVYRLEGEELVLDEFVGEPTDHVRIPVGVGVCGTAVAENANQVIEDVRELDNYLSCSAKTRSEIVVLIRDENGTILGQIDIDGHTVGAFDSSDEELLTQMAARLAVRWDD